MRQRCFQIYLSLFITCLLTSCEKIDMEASGQGADMGDGHNVLIRVVDVDAGWNGSVSRSQVSIAEVCSRLQFAVYRDGDRVKYANQSTSDGSFGSFAVQLEAGVYQLLVLSHSGASNVTTTNPEKLQFKNPGASGGTGFTDTFYYYGDMIVGSDGTLADIHMKRATSMFRLKTADGKPADVKKFQFYYTGGSGTLNAITGCGCVKSQQKVPVELSGSRTGEPLIFEMYTFLHQENGVVTFTVTALGDDDNVLYTKKFEVPMRRNCVTQYTGNFFTDDNGETPAQPNFPDDDSPYDEPSGGITVDPGWDHVFDYTF